MAARLRMVRAYSFLFMKGKLARRSSSLMMVRASASMISATIGSRPDKLRLLGPLEFALNCAKDSVRHWSNRVPLEFGMAIAGWLVNHGGLVGQPNKGGASS
jgi:hypothetical protein